MKRHTIVPEIAQFSRCTAVAVSCVLASVSAHAQSLPISVTTDEHTNGLRVVYVPLANRSTVSVSMRLASGSAVDPRENPGLSCVSGQLFLQSTPASAQRSTQDNWDCTADDIAMVTSSSSHELQYLLWLASERMRAVLLPVSAYPTFRAEVLPVVLRGFDPMETASNTALYGDYYPYAHPLFPTTNTNFSVEQLRTHRVQYHVPQRAVIAVTGNFQLEAVRTWARQAFDRLPTFGVTLQEQSESASFPTPSNQTVTVPTQNATTAGTSVRVSYLVSGYRSPDFYALELLCRILADGQSSLLFRALGMDEHIAERVSAWIERRNSPNTLVIQVQLLPGQSGSQVQTIIDRELERIISRGLQWRTLERARNRLRSDYLLRLERSDSLASETSLFELRSGNANLINTELDRYQSVTLEDLHRVVQEQLVASRRVIATSTGTSQ